MKDGNYARILGFLADFLETIVFVRNGEDWLIDRYDAAEVNAWHCSD